MPTPTKPTAHSDKLHLYEKPVATNLKIERKGATNPYTSLNEHLFLLHPSGSVALRFPKDERESFLKKYNTKLFEAYGIVQKEYVTVPDALLENTKELQKLLRT